MIDYIEVEIVKIYDYGVLVVNEYEDIKTIISLKELSDKYIDNIYDEFYEGQIIKVVENGYHKGKKAYSRKKYKQLKKQNKQNLIWQHQDFDEAYQVENIINIKKIIKKVSTKNNSYEVKVDGGLIGILQNVPRNIINLQSYIETNETKAIITKIDKEHKKIYFKLDINENLTDDIEEVKYEDSENHKLYIDIQKHKQNLTNDIINIQKNDKSFFQLYKFSEMELDEIADIFFSEVLLEDMEQSLFFSNVSLSDDELKIVIRLDRSNRLLESIPKDKTILLQGYLQHELNSPVFTINRIIYQSNYPKKRFEIQRDTTVYFRSEDVYESERDRNILTQEFISILPQLSKIAKIKLQDWNEFLNWQKEYINKNMIGFKYLSYKIDENEEKIIFDVVLDEKDKNRLNKLAKNGELAIFSNESSTKNFIFDFNENQKRLDMIMLGDFEESYESNSSFEKEIKKEIENPIRLSLVFNLRDNEDELIDYEKIQSDGFLAVNDIGHLTQIKRQEKALKQVLNGNTYNPFLTSWLFNIKNANLPKKQDVEIDFFNKNLNISQQSAVKKMLLVPNIGLLQGPPGTGKTTVIAELIYQFTKNNQKVLLSSQSNLAVDNALDRLANLSQIRAIRLGKPSKISEEAKKFVESNIVENFYKNISQNIKDKFLNKKEDLEEKINELKRIKQNLEILNKKSDEYNEKIKQLKEKEFELNEQFQQKQKNIETIKQENKNLEIKRKGFEKVITFLKDDIDDIEFFIDSFDFLKSLENLFHQYEHFGINLYFDDLINSDLDIDKKNKIFKESLFKIKSLYKLKNEIEKDITIKNIDNYEVEKLKKELNKLEEQFEATEDEDEEFKLHKQIKQLKKEIKNYSNSFFDKSIYKEVLSNYEQVKTKTDNEKKEYLKQFLNLDIKIKDLLINSIEKIVNNIELKNTDTKLLSQLETEIKTIQEDIKITQESIQKNNKNITQIYTRLKNLNIEKDDINIAIESYNSYLEENLSNSVVNLLANFTKRIDNRKKLTEEEKEAILEKYIKNSNVVAVTLNENTKILEKYDFNMFDVAIIDEVSKATPTELLAMISLAKKVILVGDHRQLPPVWSFNDEKGYKQFLEEIKENNDKNLDNQEYEVNKNNETLLTKENYEKFEKMVNGAIFKEYFEQADNSLKESLLIQYRMHTQIMNVINRFYENKLQQGLKHPDKDRYHELSLKFRYELINHKKHAVWIDTTYNLDGSFNEEQKPNTSRTNQLEVDVIENLLSNINKKYLELGYNQNNRKEVGIIAFYGAQVGLLKRQIGGYKKLINKFEALKVEINTVDKYQGKEKDIIIVSMTRNKKINSKYKKLSSNNKTSFIAQFERINVAFSRAKELLVVVGAKEMFEDYEVKLPKMDQDGYIVKKVYKEIIDYIKSYNGYYKISELKGLINENSNS